MIAMKKLVFAALFVAAVIATDARAVGREIAPRGAAPTSYPTSEPRVAYSGERYLAVWAEDMSSIGLHLMGAFSDAAGRRISPIAFPVLRDFGGRTLQLVGMGDAYALFWRDFANVTRLTELDLAGRVTRTTALDLPPHIDFRAAWNGTRFFVALRHPVGEQYQAEGVLLERSGAVVRRDLPIADDAYASDVTAENDGFAVVTSGFSGVAVHRVSAAGDVTSSPIDPMPSGVARIATAGDGGLLVVWTASTELRATRVTAAGQVEAPRVLATAQQPMSVVHVRRAGAKHLITYITLTGTDRSGLATLALHADGTLTPPPAIEPLFSGAVLTPVVAASSPNTTFAVFAKPDQWPAPMMSVAIADAAVASEPEVVSVSRARQSQPVLGKDGGRLLAAWSDIQGYAAFAFVAARELGWNGSEYLLVAIRDGRLLGVRMTAGGRPLDAEPLVLADTHSSWSVARPTVAWVGDRWVVAWETQGRIAFVTVRAGSVGEMRELLPEGAPLPDDEWGRSAAAPALSFNGSTLLLVWKETQAPPCWFPACHGGMVRAYAVRLTREGEVAGAPVEIPLAQGRYSIATSGQEFLVLGDTTATIVDAAVAPRILGSRSILSLPATGTATWDGSTYAIALRYRVARWYLSVTRVDRELNAVGTPRGTETLPPDELAAPSMAAGILAVQEGDPVDGARAVIYRESDLTALPAPPPAPNVRVLAMPDGRFEVTWDPVETAEVYRVEARTLDGVRWIAAVRAGQPLRVVTQYANVRVIAMNAGGASEPQPRRRGARH